MLVPDAKKQGPKFFRGNKEWTMEHWKEITGTEAKILVAIAYYHNNKRHECCPTLESLAKFTGICKGNISRKLRDMAGRGLITIRKEKRPGGGHIHYYSSRFIV